MRRILLVIFSLAFASGAQAQNYTATAGSGLTFGAKLGSGSVLFPYFIGCDATTPTQCWTVNSSGQLSVTVASPVQVIGPTAVGSANTTAPIQIGGTATGAAGANVEGLAIKPASTAAAATDLSAVTNESPNSQLSTTTGTTGDAACSTDNGTCTLPALLKRNNQNLTTLNTTAGNPAQLAVNVTPTDCSGTVATGGTAVNAFTAQTTLHGFTILNDDTSEPLWISFTTTAAASTAGSYPLAPATATSFAGASSYTTPPGFGTNHALSVIAATSSHKFSCTWW